MTAVEARFSFQKTIIVRTVTTEDNCVSHAVLRTSTRLATVKFNGAGDGGGKNVCIDWINESTLFLRMQS